MALNKNERILNLLFALMSTKSFLTKDQIKDIIEAYRPLNDEAFERKFERDKDELRALGVPIETGSHDPFGTNDGYRINRKEIELPDIDLQPEEAAVVALAGQVWQDSAMGDAVTTSLTKLKTIGVAVETETLPILGTQIRTDEPAFEDVSDALQTRRAFSFEYVDSQGQPSVRKLQPWRLLNWQARWYVAGYDLDREEPRIFRLSRFASKPKLFGPAGTYDIPEDLEFSQIASKMFPQGGDKLATLSVSKGRAQLLRKRAQSCEEQDERDVLTLTYANTDDFANEICSFGPDVIVQGPAELQARVIAKLSSLAGVA